VMSEFGKKEVTLNNDNTEDVEEWVQTVNY
jgi:hypothetical protein